MVRKGIRQTDKAFFGVGCPHPSVDCLTRQLSLVLIHFGSNTAVGKILRISMEIMIIELGMGTQPFQVDYNKYGWLVTASWLKSLWEKADRVGITLTESVVEMPMPRENDNWLMQIFAENGYRGDELIQLNRVRLHQQVLFVSDVLDSSCWILEKKYLQQRNALDKRSYLFPRQLPPEKDFKLWRLALQGVR